MSVFHIFQHGGISSLRLCEHARSPCEKRYLEKISCLVIDPVLIPDKTYDPECLPPVESMDLLSFLTKVNTARTNIRFIEVCRLITNSWFQGL